MNAFNDVLMRIAVLYCIEHALIVTAGTTDLTLLAKKYYHESSTFSTTRAMKTFETF